MYTIYLNGTKFAESGDYEYAVASPVVSVQKGKSPSASFTVLPNHPRYSEIVKMKSIVKVTQNEEEIFYGRVCKVSVDFYKQMKVECEGLLSFLNDTVIPKIGKKTETPGDYLKILITEHNSQVDDSKKFTVHTVTATTSTTKETYNGSSYTSTLSQITSNLTSKHQGYLVATRKGTTNYLDWISDYKTNDDGTNGQTIEFGKNLIDLQSNNDSNGVYTVLLPLGKNSKTVKDKNGGSIYVKVSDAAVNQYGWIVRTKNFSTITDEAALLAKAQEYNAKYYSDNPISLTIKALDLKLLGSNVESFSLGDRIRITSPAHGLNGAIYPLKSISYNLIDPSATSYTFGVDTDEDRSNGGSTGISGGVGGLSSNMEIMSDQIHWNEQQVTIHSDQIQLNADSLLKLYSGGKIQIAGEGSTYKRVQKYLCTNMYQGKVCNTVNLVEENNSAQQCKHCGKFLTQQMKYEEIEVENPNSEIIIGQKFDVDGVDIDLWNQTDDDGNYIFRPNHESPPITLGSYRSIAENSKVAALYLSQLKITPDRIYSVVAHLTSDKDEDVYTKEFTSIDQTATLLRLMAQKIVQTGKDKDKTYIDSTIDVMAGLIELSNKVDGIEAAYITLDGDQLKMGGKTVVIKAQEIEFKVPQYDADGNLIKDSYIKITPDQIAATVHKVSDNADNLAKLTIDADRINWYVGSVTDTSMTQSQIQQSAGQIKSIVRETCKDPNTGQYISLKSYIEQTAGQIKIQAKQISIGTKDNDTINIGSLKTTLNIKANEVDFDVDNYTIDASHIKFQVQKEDSSGSPLPDSYIDITSDSIASLVHKLSGDVDNLAKLAVSADKITTYVGEVTSDSTTTSQITQTAKQIKSMVKETCKDEKTGQYITLKSYIEQTAGEIDIDASHIKIGTLTASQIDIGSVKSAMNLSADKLTVQAKNIDFDTDNFVLNAKYIDINGIVQGFISTNIVASTLKANTSLTVGGAGIPGDHTAEIYGITYAYGGLVVGRDGGSQETTIYGSLSIPSGLNDGNQSTAASQSWVQEQLKPENFNIADTTTYKNGVASAVSAVFAEVDDGGLHKFSQTQVADENGQLTLAAQYIFHPGKEDELTYYKMFKVDVSKVASTGFTQTDIDNAFLNGIKDVIGQSGRITKKTQSEPDSNGIIKLWTTYTYNTIEYLKSFDVDVRKLVPVEYGVRNLRYVSSQHKITGTKYYKLKDPDTNAITTVEDTTSQFYYMTESAFEDGIKDVIGQNGHITKKTQSDPDSNGIIKLWTTYTYNTIEYLKSFDVDISDYISGSGTGTNLSAITVTPATTWTKVYAGYKYLDHYQYNLAITLALNGDTYTFNDIDATQAYWAAYNANTGSSTTTTPTVTQTSSSKATCVTFTDPNTYLVSIPYTVTGGGSGSLSLSFYATEAYEAGQESVTSGGTTTVTVGELVNYVGMSGSPKNTYNANTTDDHTIVTGTIRAMGSDGTTILKTQRVQMELDTNLYKDGYDAGKLAGSGGTTGGNTDTTGSLESIIQAGITQYKVTKTDGTSPTLNAATIDGQNGITYASLSSASTSGWGLTTVDGNKRFKLRAKIKVLDSSGQTKEFDDYKLDEIATAIFNSVDSISSSSASTIDSEDCTEKYNRNIRYTATLENGKTASGQLKNVNLNSVYTAGMLAAGTTAYSKSSLMVNSTAIVPGSLPTGWTNNDGVLTRTLYDSGSALNSCDVEEKNMVIVYNPISKTTVKTLLSTGSGTRKFRYYGANEGVIYRQGSSKVIKYTPSSFNGTYDPSSTTTT